MHPLKIRKTQKHPQFRKKQKRLFVEIFGLPHTSNRIYLLRNCFSNYVFLKDICSYITEELE